MKIRARRPAAYALNDPNVVVSEDKPDAAAGSIQVIPEPDNSTLPTTQKLAAPIERRFRWVTLFLFSLFGLATLGLGLAVTRLVEDLFVRSTALGSLGLAFAALAALALTALLIRETRGLLQLSAIETIHNQAAATIVSDEHADGVAVVRALLHLTRNSPMLARARQTVKTHLDDIIDGADLVRLAERNLMAPLDQEAKRLVSAAAKRVSIVTAVSPRAAVDMLFVLVTAIGLIRRLALTYGGRPGMLGTIRLIRLCIAHLTVTGGLAVGDGLVQQVLGHGLVAKLSTRLGEGVLNGLLTARLGLAAIEVTRPLPFNALPRPAVTDLAADLLRQRDDPDRSGSHRSPAHRDL